MVWQVNETLESPSLRRQGGKMSLPLRSLLILASSVLVEMRDGGRERSCPWISVEENRDEDVQAPHGT